MPNVSFFDIEVAHRLPSFFFFFNDPATPDIYPFPLHAALPIWVPRAFGVVSESIQSFALRIAPGDGGVRRGHQWLARHRAANHSGREPPPPFRVTACLSVEE